MPPAEAAAGAAIEEPTEYPLVAYYDSSVKTSLIKLAPTSSTSVSLLNWSRPLKLNRKEQYVIRQLAEEERKASAAVVADGLDVKSEQSGADKDVKMEGGDGGTLVKEERNNALIGPSTSTSVAVSVAPPTKRPWGKQKKTKQVFIAADQSARLLRKEEHAPWLLEDGTSPNGERWIGRFEGSSNGIGEANADSPYVIFRLNESGNFEIIPLHRVYRFTPRPAYEPLDTDQAELAYERMQKSGGKEEVQRWLAKKRNSNNRSTSQVGVAPVARPERGMMPMLPGNRGIRTVNVGSRLAMKDEDEDVKPKLGAEADFDEFEFEEDFADDEEGGNLNDEAMDEEELRELEEKIKKEMRAAGRAGDDGQRHSPDVGNDEADMDVDEAKQTLTKEGKATKKLLRRKAKDGEYSSDDDDENPYASQDDDDDDSDASTPGSREHKRMESGGSRSAVPSRPPSRAGTPSLARASSSARLATPHAGSRSRASSPGAAHSHRPGHALVAHRATSPRPGDRDWRSESRDKRPVPSSRGTSPAPGGRRDSVGPPSPNKVVAAAAAAAKRKYAGDGQGSAHPASKRLASATVSGASTPTGGGGSGGSGLITEEDVVLFLRGRGMVATSELLKHFRRRLKDERNKGVIRTLVTKVGMMNGGNVGLKAEYQGH